MVEDEVVDALVAAVVADYPRLSHRYYAMKAKWLGLEKLQHWDRNAPLPDDDDAHIAWPEAKRRVLGAYGALRAGDGRDRRPLLRRRGWIDAELRAGKAGGAFSHPTVPSAHPYVLLNYHGRTRDVMTLAHELGHGVHQVLAADQGYLRVRHAAHARRDGERVRRDADLPRPARCRDQPGTPAHHARGQGRGHAEHRGPADRLLPLRTARCTTSGAAASWCRTASARSGSTSRRESLGPAFEFTPDYGVFWSYVPHFIHTPFYVYAYAFGDCLVNALYAVFQSAAIRASRQKYLDMLRAGGTKRHKELLAPFGLDASDPAFWRRGLDVIAGLHRRAGGQPR